MKIAAKHDGPQGSGLMANHSNGLTENHSNPEGLYIEEEDADVGKCGWWCWRPLCLHRFRTAKCLLFCLCWGGALQGMVVNGFVNTIISTIERRFGLTSKESGIIAASYDIASLCCLLPVSYFGGNGNKPRWLGFGVLIIGVGSFVFALPHFITNAYKISENIDYTCSAFKNATISTSCDSSSFLSVSYVKYLFILGQLLHGAGAAPLYTLGVAFLDENVQQKMSAVYVGIYLTMAIVGPAVGYLLGAQFLTIYTDIGRVNISHLGLNEYSSSWIGAWWIPFLLSGFIALIIAIPILAFPVELPGKKYLQLQRISEAHKVSASSHGEIGSSLRDLPKVVQVLFSNPTFMFLNLAGASEGLLVTGFATFTPKFIESQFSVVAGTAAILVGIVTVPAGGGGTFLGGWLCKKMRLKVAGVLKLCITFSSLSLVLSLIFLANCYNNPFAGVNVPYNDSYFTDPLLPNLTSQCNVGCMCDMENFEIVCGIDNVMYYSACHAGCTQVKHQINTKMFFNCSCINVIPKENGIMAVAKSCDTSCTLLPAFLLLFFFVITFTFMSSIPALTATLRCVSDNHRSFALGIQWLEVRLLGTIPSPILFGALIDLTCILWSKSCGNQGSCSAYSNWDLSKYMLLLGITGKSFTTAFLFFSWLFYKPAVEVVHKNGVIGEDSGYTSTPDVSPTNSPVQGEYSNTQAVSSSNGPIQQEFNNKPDVSPGNNPEEGES